MLKQILKAGYVDPELLDLLTDEQKDVSLMAWLLVAYLFLWLAGCI